LDTGSEDFPDGHEQAEAVCPMQIRVGLAEKDPGRGTRIAVVVIFQE
jgi:hypothetical protein